MRSLKSRVRHAVGTVDSCPTSIIGLIGTAGKDMATADGAFMETVRRLAGFAPLPFDVLTAEKI